MLPLQRKLPLLAVKMKSNWSTRRPSSFSSKAMSQLKIRDCLFAIASLFGRLKQKRTDRKKHCYSVSNSNDWKRFGRHSWGWKLNVLNTNDWTWKPTISTYQARLTCKTRNSSHDHLTNPYNITFDDDATYQQGCPERGSSTENPKAVAKLHEPEDLQVLPRHHLLQVQVMMRRMQRKSRKAIKGYQPAVS